MILLKDDFCTLSDTSKNYFLHLGGHNPQGQSNPEKPHLSTEKIDMYFAFVVS